MRDGDNLSGWLREAAHEIDSAHALLDAHKVPRAVADDGVECTLAARIAMAIHTDDMPAEVESLVAQLDAAAAEILRYDGELAVLRALLAAANWPHRQMAEGHPDLEPWQVEALAWVREREREREVESLEQLRAGAALARIELDTALSRIGRSDHDVRLCIERARAAVADDIKRDERIAARARLRPISAVVDHLTGGSAMFVHLVEVEGRDGQVYVFADFDDARAFVEAVRSAGGAACEPFEEVLIDRQTAKSVVTNEADD